MSPINFIEALRKTDEYIKDIYSNGGCYQFALLLCKIYKNSEVWINGSKDHCVAKIGERWFDINGNVPLWKIHGLHYHPITEEEKRMAEKWSFSRNYKLKITECPFCEEPITFPMERYKPDETIRFQLNGGEEFRF